MVSLVEIQNEIQSVDAEQVELNEKVAALSADATDDWTASSAHADEGGGANKPDDEAKKDVEAALSSTPSAGEPSTPTYPEKNGEVKTSTEPPGPSDPQLFQAIQDVRRLTPTLGVPKLLLKLKEAHPSWSLSEKRLRRFLTQHPHLSGKEAAKEGQPQEPLWVPGYEWEADYVRQPDAGEVAPLPQSHLDDELVRECRAKGCKVEPVTYNETAKGSGLIAKEKLVKGSQIFKEDAYLWVPGTKSLSRAIQSGQACAFCGRLFSTQRARSQVPCPHHPAPGSKAAQQLAAASTSSTTSGTSALTGGAVQISKPGGPEPCYQKFCNRVCAGKSAEMFGPLVCPQRNPEYLQVVRQADSEEWRAPHLVFKLFARMLIANEQGEAGRPEADGVAATAEESVVPAATAGSEDAKPPIEAVNKPVEGEAETEASATLAAGIVAAGPKKSKRSKAKKKSAGWGGPEATGPSTEMQKVINKISGLATISERTRRERAATHAFAAQMIEIRYSQLWKIAWHIVIRALHLNTGYKPKPTPGEENGGTDEWWAGYWKRRLDARSIRKLFGIGAFLELMGKMALNTEADYGIYLLHARINHSCDPNSMVIKQIGGEDRSKVAPSSIYVVAKRDIDVEEEITITYVSTDDMPVDVRRKKLYEEYCFSCFCDRCRQELEVEAKAKEDEGDGPAIKEIGNSESGLGEKEKTLEEEKSGLVDELRNAFS